MTGDVSAGAGVAEDSTVAAMREADVDRFATLVGAGVREESEHVSLSGTVMGALLNVRARDTLGDDQFVRKMPKVGLHDG